MKYSSSDHLAIMKEVFPMTVKGISQTCLGDVFDNEDQLDKLSEAYHKCWREMEVKSLTNSGGFVVIVSSLLLLVASGAYCHWTPYQFWWFCYYCLIVVVVGCLRSVLPLGSRRKGIRG